MASPSGEKSALPSRVLRGQPYRAALVATTALAAAVAATRCGSTETQVIGPDTVRCATSVSAPSSSVPAEGGRVTITIDAARDCVWTASADAPWLQLSATTGQGAGSIVATAPSNPNAVPRTAGIQVNEQQLSLTQEPQPCRFNLRPASVHVGAAGGRETITVTTLAACSWEVKASASWIDVPDETRTGSGAFEFEVEPNNGSSREGTIRVGDQSVTVAQSHVGAPSPGPVPVPQPPGPGPSPDPSGPPAPTSLSRTVVSDSRVDLSWTNTDPTAQTQVYRNGALVATKNAGVSSHQDTGLTRATDYTYVVRHVKNGLVGPESNSVVGRPVFFATGGSISSSGGYRQHVFTGSGSFVVTQGGTIDEIIIIGGGGGGGGSEEGTEWGSGGGGAGGVRVITMRSEAPGTYTVTIGGGGSGGGRGSSNPANNNGRRGGASSYGNDSAQGGGGGAGAGSNYLGNPGGDGGSGGGGSGAPGGAGVSGEGHAGGAGTDNRGGAAGGGGGGGRGGPGSPANGGQGGAGGAGYQTWAGTVASGGRGGRGDGGAGRDGVNAGDGGEGNISGGNGGRGANGAVLIRYRQ